MAGVLVNNENCPGGPGSPERGVGLGRPSRRTRRHAGFRGARPPRAPSRPGHLRGAQGTHPCSPAPSARPLPAHGAPRPCAPGAAAAARAHRGPRSRSEPSRAGLTSPALRSGSAAALAAARSGSGLFIHPFTLPPQASLGLAPPTLTSPPRRPAPAPVEPERAIGAPLPGRTGWRGAGRNYYVCVLISSLLLPHPPSTPACHLQPTAVCGFDPQPHSFWRPHIFHCGPGQIAQDRGSKRGRTTRCPRTPLPASSHEITLCAPLVPIPPRP